MNNKLEENEELNSSKKSNKKIKYIFTIIGNVIFYLIIVLLLLWSVMNINAGSKNGGFPNIFGRGFLSVQSDSMTKNGILPSEYSTYSISQFSKGDLLNVNVFDQNQFNSLKKGDVITYYDENIKNLNSHRIVYINYKNDGTIDSIAVQGDKSASFSGVFNPDDPNMKELNFSLQNNKEVVLFDKNNNNLIKGVATSVTYGAGNVLDNLHQNWLWYFVLPVGLLLIFELFMVIKNFMELKGTKQKAALAGDKEAMLAEIQAEKEKMRQELLAELKAQQAQEAKTEEKDTPSSDE